MKEHGFSVAMVAIQIALCGLEYAVTGRLDLRAVFVTVAIPLLMSVCSRGMATARTMGALNFWSALGFGTLALIAVIFLTRAR